MLEASRVRAHVEISPRTRVRSRTMEATVGAALRGRPRLEIVFAKPESVNS